MFSRTIGRALLAASLVLGAGQAAADGLESKVEQLGTMDKIKVESIRAVKRNDFLNLQAEIANDSTSDQSLFYRFKWLDASGFQTGGEEGWKQLVIHGKQRAMIQAIAPTMQAADFRIELQSPNNTVNPFK
ncbi:YcfL family protein [Paludibacterium paludis]|uniref:DUF1425 domain-containing protein n=1 Tax=Paludibacterium paludis TaxID=1225769 RepID=A0A918UAW7_9NEIS|nr:YcfL family protein [Paludibacterium paludis]GGY25341.1 hypothetical protein GCM10011289_31160 [Paludibacterium paludis]